MTKRSLADVLADTHAAIASGVDPVKVGLIRRIMPNIIANEICSVQPMTGPNPFTYAMRVRFNPWGCGNACAGDSWGYFFDTAVDFYDEHPVYKDSEPARLWAVQNVRHPYNYAMIHVASSLDRGLSVYVWRWSFADQDEAFQFKVRWS